MHVFAGVDIGGTMTKVGVLGEQFESVSFSTPQCGDMLADAICSELSKLAGTSISAVGVGCPGAVDKYGVVSYMPNLDISNFDIANKLRSRLNTDVFVTNDANAAALGESLYGGYSDAVMLTLGTGVGGGVIIGGKVYDGPMGKAAELGHMIIDVDGMECGCGMKGCLEAYVSASALIRDTVCKMNDDRNSVMWELCPNVSMVDGKVAFEAAKLGDSTANDVVNNYVKYLGVGIINLCNIFRPQAIIIGGGVSNQGEFLLAPLRKICEKYNFGYTGAPKPHIVKASLGPLAGLYGAIAFAKNSLEAKIINERT